MTDERHEATGLIRVSRVSGGRGVLVGSDVPHRRRLEIKVFKAVEDRSLSHDTFYPRDTIVSLEMSESQFARFVASVGMGTGVPCTLKSIEGQGLEDPEARDTEQTFKKEAVDSLEDAVERAERLEGRVERLMERGGEYLSKSDRKDLLNEVTQLRQQLSSNLPFIIDSLHEAVEKTVNEAKSDIATYTGRQLDRLQGAADAVGADVDIRGLLGHTENSNE